MILSRNKNCAAFTAAITAVLVTGLLSGCAPIAAGDITSQTPLFSSAPSAAAPTTSGDINSQTPLFSSAPSARAPSSETPGVASSVNSSSAKTPGVASSANSSSAETPDAVPSANSSSAETPDAVPSSAITSGNPTTGTSSIYVPSGTVDIPFGQTKTFEGLMSSPDGQPVNILVTMGVSNVTSGQDAYNALLKDDPSVSPPPSGMEYVIADVSCTYVQGPLASLNLLESRGSLRQANAFFSLDDPGLTADERALNTNEVTTSLKSSFYDLTVEPGQTVHGQVAFWRTVGGDEPLNYCGFDSSVDLFLS